MSQYQSTQLTLAVGLLTALLAGSASLSYGVTGCRSQTPCPCTADGVCRPKRDTWGHYKTRWRTWPGEKRGDAPTVADPSTEIEETLPPFETPIPEQEDLRGPAKDKKDDREDLGPETDAGEVPAQVLPGPEGLPAIDPQGNQLQLPDLEDAPPALPESLRQAALRKSVPRSQPVAINSTAPGVQQASWQPSAPGLINPASAVLFEPASNAPQQAIYYEVEDDEQLPQQVQ